MTNVLREAGNAVSARRRGYTGASWAEYCVERKGWFRRALGAGGYSVTQFAVMVKRQRVHVHKVLEGERTSRWIENAIYRVIAAEFPDKAEQFYIAYPAPEPRTASTPTAPADGEPDSAIVRAE